MSKKTKIIIIAALALVICGGVYYAYNNWRKQQLVRQYLTRFGVPETMVNEAMKQLSDKDMADITKGMTDAGALGGLDGVLRGGAGAIGAGTGAKSLAGFFGDDGVGAPADEKEKSPEQIFNETTAIEPYNEGGKMLVNETKPWVEKVFGKSKITSLSSGMYGVEDNGSGMVVYRVSRKIQTSDISLLIAALQSEGFTVAQSGIDDGNGSIMAIKSENEQLSASFMAGEQEIGIVIYRMSE